MSIIGIDTDSRGSICVADFNKGNFEFFKMPTKVIKRKNIVQGAELYLLLSSILNRRDKPVQIWLEQQNAFPGQGVTSMFSFGRTYGTIICAVETAVSLSPWETPIKYVRGMTWKPVMGVGKEKRASKEAAKKLMRNLGFDEIEKLTIPQADALMIAAYGFKKYESILK
jgi:crossover junction endodeoxyribonuclease RuvC